MYATPRGMAELREISGTRTCVLESEHLVGRSAGCALRLDSSYVSAQHALLRWQGHHWEIVDRGSRNGTRLNGVPLAPGQASAVYRGAIIAFGHENEQWTLSDAGAPSAMVVALDTGETFLGDLGLIGIPSDDDTTCTLYVDRDGQWMLERCEDDVRRISTGESFEAFGRKFRFSCPVPSNSTAAASSETLPQTILDFAVSSDEEFVELRLENAIGSTDLGARSLNYLLLLLARAYLADVADGASPATCGWLDKDTIARNLAMTAQQVDGEVFRIRKHFAQRGLPEAATIIERRPRTRQLRIGISAVRVRKI